MRENLEVVILCGDSRRGEPAVVVIIINHNKEGVDESYFSVPVAVSWVLSLKTNLLVDY